MVALFDDDRGQQNVSVLFGGFVIVVGAFAGLLIYSAFTQTVPASMESNATENSRFLVDLLVVVVGAVIVSLAIRYR